MLYLLLAVSHYKQLARVDQALVTEVRAAVAQVEGRYGYTRLAERQGSVLYRLGNEHSLDPRRAAAFCFDLHGLLAARREELYGFNLLLAVEQEEEDAAGTLLRRLEKRQLEAEEDEEVWFEAASWRLVSGFLAGSQQGELWRVESKTLPALAGQPQGEGWKQSPLARELAGRIRASTRGSEPAAVLLVHGRDLTQRRLLVDALQRRLFARSPVACAPRAYPLLKRRSAIHPLLNSVDPLFVRKAAQYLTAAERGAWHNLAGVLWSLKPGASFVPGAAYRWPRGIPDSVRPAPAPLPSDASQEEEPPSELPAEAELLGGLGGFRPAQLREVRPDHLATDFRLAYQLYLTAYFRMMEENLRPALLICEEADTYLPRTLEMVAALVQSFSHNPTFVPLLTASGPEPPEPLRRFPLETFALRAPTLKECAGAARRLYPGLSIPRGELKALRARSRGQRHVFPHLLRELERQGRIAKSKGGYCWEAAGETGQPEPPGPLSAAWSSLSTQPFAVKRLLYVVYLQSGLLDLWGLFAFLETLEVAEADAFAFLQALCDQGFVHATNHAIPLFPRLRKRLRREVLRQEPGLERRLVDYLVGLWRAGSYPHRVLLYFLLSKARRPAAAVEVLAELLEQKLDELDFQGVRIFLDPKHFRLEGAFDPEAQKDVRTMLASARMRLCLLVGDDRQAEELYLKAMELGGDFQVKAAKGRLFLQVGDFLLARGEAGMGLQWVKKAQIQFQGAGDSAGERVATAALGTVLLAEARFEEALEYFSLAEQSPAAVLDVAAVQGEALLGVALFLVGNLSRAQVEVERGLSRARYLKCREWQLFLEFLRGRILFEFGFYSEALLDFQEALATEALYENGEARRVLYAWLGRTFAYLGAAETALRVLGAGEEHWEKHLFLAEAHMFREEYLRALEHCDRALAGNKVLDTLPGRRPLWVDGFWDVECRCLPLLRENALTRRLIQAFQAYLWSLEGSGERAVEQLYSITRGERLPEADPYQSLYNYFYARTLPEVRKDELDDSLTVLNKSLKLLQQRASRIEDSTQRWRYLNNNYWNARLFLEARQRKLL